LIECEFSSTGIATEISHIQFDVLSSEFLLVGLELQELLAVDHSATTSATTSTCSTSQDLLALAVGCLNANYNVAVAHADVAELDFEVVAWNDHSNEADVLTVKECQLEAQTYLEKKHTQGRDPDDPLSQHISG
jgi:hypothetical protein